jgi:hypothetical protein
MFYFHLENNARWRQIATNSTWEVKSCFRPLTLEDLPFVSFGHDLGGNSFEIGPLDIWFRSPITMSSTTTTLFGLSAEINVTLSTEVKSTAQQQNTSHFTLNSRTRAISHSTAGHEPFHTQQQDTSHFTLNSRTRAISHSTAGHEPFHTQQQDTSHFTLILGYGLCSFLKTMKWWWM